MRNSKTFMQFVWSGLMIAIASLSFTAHSAPRIVGGEQVQISETPWQVYLEVPQGDGTVASCGASILSDQWILTAAHCFWGGDGEVVPFYLLGDVGDGAVIIGETDLNNISVSNIYFFSVKNNVYIHPASVVNQLSNDIALVHIPSAMDLDRCGANCSAIDMVTPALSATTAPHSTRAYVSGWGGTIGYNPETVSDFFVQVTSDTLKGLDVIIQSCGYGYPANYEDTVICAGAENMFLEDSCQGDSGGPLTVKSNDGTKDLLAGVVSNGYGCAAGIPGEFMRVSAYYDWIVQTMANSVNTEGSDSESVGEGSMAESNGHTIRGGGGGGSLGAVTLLILAGLAGIGRRVRL